MLIENAIFTQPDHSVFSADYDGQNLSVPASEGNMHYDELLRQGITPADYVPPVLSRGEQIAALLADTETSALLARKLEDVIQVLDASPDIAMTQESKDWATDRQTKRDSVP